MRSIIPSLLLITLVALTTALSIDRASVTIETKTGDASERSKVDLASSLKQPLNLTQSSIIKLQAKVNLPTRRSLSLSPTSSQNSCPSVCATKSTRASPSQCWLNGTVTMRHSMQ